MVNGKAIVDATHLPVAADLENGMFEGDSTSAPSNTSVTGMSYVTAMLKGPSGNAFGLKAGNARFIQRAPPARTARSA